MALASATLAKVSKVDRDSGLASATGVDTAKAERARMEKMLERSIMLFVGWCLELGFWSLKVAGRCDENFRRKN